MRITWAPEARRQVHEIWRYIALDNPEAADRMVTRLADDDGPRADDQDFAEVSAFRHEKVEKSKV